jgi:hypothetical protein
VATCSGIKCWNFVCEKSEQPDCTHDVESGKSPTVLQVKASVETEQAKSISRAVAKKSPFKVFYFSFAHISSNGRCIKQPLSFFWYSNQAMEWTAEESWFDCLKGKDTSYLFQSDQTDSGVHPASYSMGTGRAFPVNEAAGASSLLLTIQHSGEFCGPTPFPNRPVEPLFPCNCYKHQLYINSIENRLKLISINFLINYFTRHNLL